MVVWWLGQLAELDGITAPGLWVTWALTLVIPLVAGSSPLLLVVAGSLQGEEAVGAAFPSCCHLLGSEWHFHIAVGKQGGKKACNFREGAAERWQEGRLCCTLLPFASSEPHSADAGLAVGFLPLWKFKAFSAP